MNNLDKSEEFITHFGFCKDKYTAGPEKTSPGQTGHSSLLPPISCLLSPISCLLPPVSPVSSSSFPSSPPEIVSALEPRHCETSRQILLGFLRSPSRGRSRCSGRRTWWAPPTRAGGRTWRAALLRLLLWNVTRSRRPHWF